MVNFVNYKPKPDISESTNLLNILPFDNPEKIEIRTYMLWYSLHINR